MKHVLPLVATLLATTALAEETRQLDAHEHGVGTLNIAFEGDKVAMEFLAPGADIVGFEYKAESAKDREAIENALATLARPSDLFVLPSDANCTVTQASASLEAEEDHDNHEDDHGHEDHADHDEHDHKEHDHEEHAEHDEHDHEEHAEHDEHDHEEHAEHDEHDHEEHAEHDEHDHEEHAEHDEHDHDEDHEKSASHTEFHAEYQLTCANPDAISNITFAYFNTFENAREVEVQIVTSKGAQAFEVERDEPKLDLRGLF